LNNINITVSSPHQKVIMTKKTLSDADHLYSRANIEAMLTAATNLSDKTFKLYARMNLHQDDYVYALSPTAIKKEIGMSAEKYRNAVNELKAKGYLQLVPGRKNLYAFYEYPQKDSSGTVCWGVNEESADQVKNPVDHDEALMGHIVNSEESSTENDGNSPTILPDDSAEQNKEIQQHNTEDITGHITEDNEEDITEEDVHDALQSISYSSEPSWQEQVEARKREQEFDRQMMEYMELISGVDPDDLHCYDHLNPALNRSFGIPDTAIDWDNPGLPF